MSRNPVLTSFYMVYQVQEYCYENMNFMRAFSKLVVMLYKTNVLSEEVILKWYREPNSSKGKMMFLDQMKKFVEWLQSAEEGKYQSFTPFTLYLPTDEYFHNISV